MQFFFCLLVLFFNRHYSLLSFGRPQLYNSEVLPFTYGQYVVIELADKLYNSVSFCFCASRKYVFHIGHSGNPMWTRRTTTLIVARRPHQCSKRVISNIEANPKRFQWSYFTSNPCLVFGLSSVAFIAIIHIANKVLHSQQYVEIRCEGALNSPKVHCNVSRGTFLPNL